MKLYKGYPVPSERMGMLWTLSSVKDLVIVEFGPEGSTRYLLQALKYFDCEAKAKIYTTMMDEEVVVLGNSEKLLKALQEVDEKNSPEYIIVFDSSVAAVIGIDVEGLCREYQPYINAKLIPITGGGLSGTYSQGVEDAFKLLVSFATQRKGNGSYFNILGCCADEFNQTIESQEIICLIKRLFNYEVNCVLPLDSSIEKCKTLGNARLNIVLRREALVAANILQEQFGTPYVYGRPYGLKGTFDWVKKIEETTGLHSDWTSLNKDIDEIKSLISNIRTINEVKASKNVIIGGHPDIVQGLKEFIVDELGLNCDSDTSSKTSDAVLVMDDGYNLSYVKQSGKIQTGYPLLEEEKRKQPALMGLSGVWYIASMLKDLL